MSDTPELNTSPISPSEFEKCLSGIYELIDFNNPHSEVLISKLQDLEIIYGKRISGFSSIIKGQREFHNANNKLVKQTDKEQRALIRELQSQVQNLKDALSVYQSIELKYADAIKQLKELKK